MARSETPEGNGKGLRFDFAALERKIVAATLQVFADVARAYPEDPVCAFALYSDDSAVTVCPAFDLRSHRAARIAAASDENEADVVTFSPAEWALELFGGEVFEDICTAVRTHVLEEVCGGSVGLLELAGGLHLDRFGDAFVAFRAELFETCVRTLERLRADGAFDAYPGLLVLFAVSDTDPLAEDEIRMLKRLNGDASPYVARYMRWAKSWGEI
jgi:hypothetical protein